MEIAERVELVELYYINGCSVTQCLRKFRAVHGIHAGPSEQAVRNLVKKFKETGSLHDAPRSGGPRTARTEQNITAVAMDVAANPSTSIRRRAQGLGLSRATLHRILIEDLGMHAYKIQLTQQLKPADHRKRRDFVKWFKSRRQGNPDFPTKVVYSDEAHFYLNGTVNKQNCRIWATENPHAIHQQPLHDSKTTVWCGFWAGGVIGPFFFDETVNGDRYREMLTKFLWPKLNELDLDNMWFQQDGATSHTARDTIELLKQMFGERVISKNADVPWPPRSCDLTPLDFFLWGFLKSRVYASRPGSIDELQQNIRHEISHITPDFCQKVIENGVLRFTHAESSRGGHLSDILFHT